MLTAALLAVVGGVLLAARVRARSPSRISETDGWTIWDDAVAWRRLDGRAFVVLFDAGGAVWSIPVDRVFAPGARVAIGGTLDQGTAPAVCANGVNLFTVETVDRVSAASAVVMRQDLVQALVGPEVAVPVPVR